jgi:hypothetical protein
VVNVGLVMGILWGGETTELDVDDYYVLFRDATVPAPTDDEYKERCEQQDLLIGDRAAYVWCYVGRLSDSQIEIVQQCLNAEVDKKLWLKDMFSDENLDDKSVIDFVRYPQGIIKVTLLEPAAADLLAQISPNLGFLSHVPLNQSFRIYPDSVEEHQRIVKSLRSRSKECIEFYYDAKKLESPKRHRSFVEIVSLKALIDMWRRIDCRRNALLLRRTAGIFVVEKLEKNTIDTSLCDFYEMPGEKVSSENVEGEFKTKIINAIRYINSKNYIERLTSHQRKILNLCVDLVNESRKKRGSGYLNIVNKYESHEEKKEAVSAMKEKPKPTRRNTPARIKDVKKIIETYWKKVINGELVTQQDVAKQKFPNEPNILSKKIAKPFMEKISEQVKMAKAKYRGIRNFDKRTIAALLTYIHDILKK